MFNLTNSQSSPSMSNRSNKSLLPPVAALTFTLKIAAILIIAMLSYSSLQQRTEASERVMRTIAISDHFAALLSIFKDAETGQRGFLLTGDQSYLAPYLRATTEITPTFHTLLSQPGLDAETRSRIETLQHLSDRKLAELRETIELYRKNETAVAIAKVQTDEGRQLMDTIRSRIAELQKEQHDRLVENQADWEAAATASAQIISIGCTLLLLLVIVTLVLISRDHQMKQLQQWLRVGQAQLGVSIQGEHNLSALGQRVLEFLARYLNMPVGVVYTVEDDAAFQRCAVYALDIEESAFAAQLAAAARTSLLTQAVRDRQPLHVRDVPENYLPISSGLGKADAASVLIAPAIADGKTQAVLELGFFREINAEDEELLRQVSEMLGNAIRSARDRTRLEALLAKLQSQSEELQMQQEELRVSNEELEEQSHVLKQSQAQLESQQAELEQINASLEEHMQLLSDQKSQLEQSQKILTAKAGELERANQYKSEFLANMSHELRTPLNSSLIFAKLLADNKDRNLTEEQVRFAETIWSAGNDLLTLINDILDLSKIEAGKVEVAVESISIPQFADGIIRSFQLLATQRQLKLTLSLAADMPGRMQTDAQRLGQILKNLLSNALKFTEAGEVSLRISPIDEHTISFAVSDTGIGIPLHQQEIIFEAFRQADGSTHRKYGGTGLGLSISRDLAHLLGGDLTVSSEGGNGSTFILTLPLIHVAPKTPALSASAPREAAKSPQVGQKFSRAEPVLNVSSQTRPAESPAIVAKAHTLLIIEDDVTFTSILSELARAEGFECTVAHTAREGLTHALEHAPNAILLDMNLPDQHGIGVLDELKQNPTTRHIPVHIISVDDHTQEALGRGAIGYALKPAQREEIVAVLQRLEEKLSQRLRRVLVVEDDMRQLESIRQLLSNGDVEITGVTSARTALEQLRQKTFDCMVMDLKLPDIGGEELLQRMAEQDDVPFPPVIVYTGRHLSASEEQQLRRFSKSIIIKDVRSPERLLDEVTLFLHQVESTLPLDRQRMLKLARRRDSAFEGRTILIVEDDARNVFALTSILEPKGAIVEIARNGREALDVLAARQQRNEPPFDAVLMDIMMPEMDGYTAIREIRKSPAWKKLPIIALTAKAMKDDQEKCLEAGANDYIAKPLDVDKLLSLLRVWMSP